MGDLQIQWKTELRLVTMVKFYGIAVSGQIEYSNEKLSAFLQGSVSNQSYQRIDDFVLPGSKQQGQEVQRKTDLKISLDIILKGVQTIILITTIMFSRNVVIIANNLL